MNEVIDKQVQEVDFAPEYPATLTIPEVAQLLRISQSHAYEMARHSDFPSYRAGRRVLVRKHDLGLWIEKQLREKTEA